MDVHTLAIVKVEIQLDKIRSTVIQFFKESNAGRKEHWVFVFDPVVVIKLHNIEGVCKYMFIFYFF